MNARQARSVVLWLNGAYMLGADHFGLNDADLEKMSQADIDRLHVQQRAIGIELIERSGLDPDLDPADLVATALRRTNPGNMELP